MAASWQGQNYDGSSDPQARWGADVVPRLPADLRGLVIDAGCGSGRVTEQLLQHAPNARVLAVDGSASMIDAARVRLAPYAERVQLQVHDLREPLQADELAAAVFSTGTFHWLHDHAALYRSLRAVTQPHGLLVAQAGGEGSLAEVMQIIGARAAQLAKLNYYASVAECESALDAGGFEALDVWLHPEPVMFASRQALGRFLVDAALAPHLEAIPEAEHAAFIDDLVHALRAPQLEFIRLNILARARA
jgi:trans-aconitate 2-methyltransferase